MNNKIVISILAVIILGLVGYIFYENTPDIKTIKNETVEENTQEVLPPAPYSPAAVEKIENAMNEIGLPEFPLKEELTSSDMLETLIQYFIKVYSFAGYDFKKSMDKFINEISINEEVVMHYIETGCAEHIYMAYDMMYNACKEDRKSKYIFEKYFSKKTSDYFSKECVIFNKEQSPSNKSMKPAQNNESSHSETIKQPDIQTANQSYTRKQLDMARDFANSVKNAVSEKDMYMLSSMIKYPIVIGGYNIQINNAEDFLNINPKLFFTDSFVKYIVGESYTFDDNGFYMGNGRIIFSVDNNNDCKITAINLQN